MNTPPIAELLVRHGTSLKEAMRAIDINAQGIVFIVDDDSRLAGVLTDGDIRRALLQGAGLSSPASGVMRTSFISRPVDTDTKELVGLLSEKIRHIPLLDENNRPVDYACIHHLRHIQVMEPVLDGNELEYVSDCIKTNWISSQGRYVREFEKLFSTYCAMPYGLAVSNGTVALHLALETLGIGPGDEVIVPDLTFAATINAVLYTGATPVIVDIEPVTWNIDPKQIEKAITGKTKAVIPVHLYGQACRLDDICKLAKKHGIFIVEDCAEAIGTLYKGRPVGSFGDISAFSFFGNKTITTGEGGMLLFKDKKLFDRASLLRDHGMSKQKKYWHDEVGYNYRMTNMQGAIGVAQMERVDDFVVDKRRLGALYDGFFSNTHKIRVPARKEYSKNSYWLYTVLLDSSAGIERDELIKKMLMNGIETRPVFFPLHMMPPYARFARRGAFPVACDVSSRGISLPSSVFIKKEEVKWICGVLLSILENRSIVKGARPAQKRERCGPAASSRVISAAWKAETLTSKLPKPRKKAL